MIRILCSNRLDCKLDESLGGRAMNSREVGFSETGPVPFSRERCSLSLALPAVLLLRNSFGTACSAPIPAAGRKSQSPVRTAYPGHPPSGDRRAGPQSADLPEGWELRALALPAPPWYP